MTEMWKMKEKHLKRTTEALFYTIKVGNTPRMFKQRCPVYSLINNLKFQEQVKVEHITLRVISINGTR